MPHNQHHATSHYLFAFSDPTRITLGVDVSYLIHVCGTESRRLETNGNVPRSWLLAYCKQTMEQSQQVDVEENILELQKIIFVIRNWGSISQHSKRVDYHRYRYTIKCGNRNCP